MVDLDRWHYKDPAIRDKHQNLGLHMLESWKKLATLLETQQSIRVSDIGLSFAAATNYYAHDRSNRQSLRSIGSVHRIGAISN